MARRARNQMWSGLFRISPGSGQTLQAQIRQALVSAILDRQMPVSEPLPSCRALASGLKVARGTVVLAYQQLVDQGFLVSEPRRGHFVNPDALVAPPKVAPDRSDGETGKDACWSRRFRFRPSASLNIEKPEDWLEYRFPFVYGQFDPSLFPTAQWRECSQMALGVREIRAWASDMVDRDDHLLIEQIQARLLPRRGIFARPEEIMVTLGAQNALFLLASLLIDRDTHVAIEDPGYPDARNIFVARTDRLTRLPIDGDGLDPDAVPEDCAYVFATPSHQCPTTVSMPMARRERLLERAEQHGVVIFEDDYDSQFLDASAVLPALKSLDRSNRVVYIGSLSKTLAPGLRLGFVVADRQLIDELRALRRLMLRHPPANNQRTAALFLSLGHHDAMVRRMTQVYERRSAALFQALEALLPEFRPNGGQRGSTIWLEGPQDIDTGELARTARRQDVLIEPGGIFHDAGHPRNTMRLGITSIALEAIAPGVDALAKTVAMMESS